MLNYPIKHYDGAAKIPGYRRIIPDPNPYIKQTNYQTFISGFEKLSNKMYLFSSIFKHFYIENIWCLDLTNNGLIWYKYNQQIKDLFDL